MGKIVNAYNSDLFGNMIYQNGSGKIYDINGDFSGNKIAYRLIKNITLLFDNGKEMDVVIKIAPLFLDQTGKDRYDTENEDLDEFVLKNEYEHEANIYNFFREVSKTDKVVNDYVLKSLDAGITKNGDFTIEGETFNFMDNTEIKHDLKYLEKSGQNIVKYVYIITQPMSYVESLSKSVPDEYLLGNFVKSTFDTLTHLYHNYKFCHWDFHSENTKFNYTTGNIVVFDFDLSQIEEYNNSDYINRVALIRPIILDFCETIEEYQVNKLKLGHNWDLFMFALSLDMYYSIEHLKKLNIILKGINFRNFLEIFDRSMILTKNIKTIINYIKLPLIFSKLQIDIKRDIDSITKEKLIISLINHLIDKIHNMIKTEYKPSLDTDELEYYNLEKDYIDKFIYIYIDFFVETYINIFINTGDIVKIEPQDYDYYFFASYYMFLEGNYFKLPRQRVSQIVRKSKENQWL